VSLAAYDGQPEQIVKQHEFLNIASPEENVRRAEIPLSGGRN
jgi:hypothetical protein